MDINDKILSVFKSMINEFKERQKWLIPEIALELLPLLLLL